MSKNYDLLQQAELGLPNVAVFPATAQNSREAASRVVSSNSAPAHIDPSVREETLKLVQRLFLSPDSAVPKTVMFAAVDSGNGCSWLCSVTARVLAENTTGSVCLVEANFRTPSLPSSSEASARGGLMDSLREDGPIRGFAQQAAPENLWLLPCGAVRDDSLNLINGNRMKERIDELRSQFDHVLVDAPPLNLYADGMILGKLLEGVVLVLEANSTRKESALRVTASLRSMNIPVLGAVLNKRTFPIPGLLYNRI
jgi:Mrp family chromosome partitioning ATPase